MDVKPGYKQTELGVIPEDWDVEPLSKYVISHNAGVYKSKSLYGSGINIVGVGDIYNINKVSEQVFRHVPLSKEEKKIFTLEEGDLIYGESSLVREGIARTIYVDKLGQETAFAWHTRRYKIEREKLESKYLYYYLASDAGRSHMINNSITTALTGINTVAYFSCPVVLPSKKEQIAIAETLSNADELIDSLERLITKKRQIKQGALHELLRPKEGWIEKRLGSTASLKARIGWQGLTTSEYMDDGDYFLVTGTEFKDGYVEWSNCYFVTEARYKQDKNIQLREQDVLVTKDGTIGKVAFVNYLEKPATLNSGVFVIRPINDAFHSEFFYYLLTSDIFIKFLNQLSAGSTINHLYQKDFVNFVYRTPKKIDEQETIATTLRDIDEEISLLEVKLSKARQIKQGMMQVLLTGRMRLI